MSSLQLWECTNERIPVSLGRRPHLPIIKTDGLSSKACWWGNRQGNTFNREGDWHSSDFWKVGSNCDHRIWPSPKWRAKNFHAFVNLINNFWNPLWSLVILVFSALFNLLVCIISISSALYSIKAAFNFRKWPFHKLQQITNQ